MNLTTETRRTRGKQRIVDLLLHSEQGHGHLRFIAKFRMTTTNVLKMSITLLLTWLLAGTALSISSRANGAEAAGAQQQHPSWVESSKAEPAGTKYRTFDSRTIGGKVSYLIYLPANYEAAKEKRYPVVYWLHGLGGSQRSGARFVRRLELATTEGKAPAMIVVLVNGLRGSMYCDSADGKAPVESVIVKDLIPHVDNSYRTIAHRRGRAVEGFSMGGFGAAHLGFKYPELFGIVSILAGALHDADSMAGGGNPKDWGVGPVRRRRIFEDVFGGKKEYFQANSPWTLVEKNLDHIRDKTHVRIIVGDQDPLHGPNRRYHELLVRLKIAHEYEVIAGVRHNYRGLFEKIGDRGFAFYAMLSTGD